LHSPTEKETAAGGAMRGALPPIQHSKLEIAESS